MLAPAYCVRPHSRTSANSKCRTTEKSLRNMRRWSHFAKAFFAQNNQRTQFFVHNCTRSTAPQHSLGHRNENELHVISVDMWLLTRAIVISLMIGLPRAAIEMCHEVHVLQRKVSLTCNPTLGLPAPNIFVHTLTLSDFFCPIAHFQCIAALPQIRLGQFPPLHVF